MTLVVTIIKDEVMFMVSDILVSAQTKLAPSGIHVSYPTKPKEPISSTLTVTDLAQKITEVVAGLYVGCSGNATCASRFIGFLRMVLPKTFLTKEVLDKACSEYFALHRADLNLFSYMILFQDDRSVYFSYRGNIDVIDVPGLGRLFVMGTGAQALMKYLKDSTFEAKMANADRPRYLQVVAYMIEYIMSMMNAQNETGLGISDGWGGGFELVACQEEGVYRKINNIMFMSLKQNTSSQRIMNYEFGKKYFQYYEGRDLIILSQYKGEAASIDAIFPADVTKRVGKTHPSSQVPQMLCIMVIDMETGKSYVLIRYNQRGHEFCGISGSRDGGHFIRVNSEALKRILGRQD